MFGNYRDQISVALTMDNRDGGSILLDEEFNALEAGVWLMSTKDYKEKIWFDTTDINFRFINPRHIVVADHY